MRSLARRLKLPGLCAVLFAVLIAGTRGQSGLGKKLERWLPSGQRPPEAKVPTATLHFIAQDPAEKRQPGPETFKPLPSLDEVMSSVPVPPALPTATLDFSVQQPTETREPGPEALRSLRSLAEELPPIPGVPTAMLAFGVQEPAEKVAEPKKAAPKPAASFWEKQPPVRIFPRPGNFFIQPTGEGYYSFLDVVTDNWRDKAPKYGYPAFGFIQFSFFDADFRYLDNPKNQDTDFFDFLHRIHITDNLMFSTGGDFRYRGVSEGNSRLSGTDNHYDLIRTRVYGDLWFGNSLRLFVEYLDAHSFNQDLAPLPIDRNRSDLLNAFVDIKLLGDCECEHPTYLRIGRQELLLGSQRLVSPLDWANTRRTFQGLRAFRQGEKFDVDLFLVQPVIPHPSHFDSVDDNQTFAGLWTTARPEKGRFLDAYYLFLSNGNAVTQLAGPAALVRAPFTTHTIGTRYTGDKNQWLWDVEGMLQFGERGAADIFAGAATVGGGYHFKHQPWNPIVWLYYDYASGDSTPNVNDYHTFNQQFPFGHYYLGWLDLVARQNIHDLNAHVYLYPAKWITVWAQYHRYWLASQNDALYNAAGIAIRRSPAGAAGANLGDELDLVVNFHMGLHSDIVIGYSHLFVGGFIADTPPSAQSPDLFFAQYSLRW